MGRVTTPDLEAALERLDRLLSWERADRSAGSPGAAAVRRIDLEPARDLVDRLGAPQAAFPAVHVAGTKGKGSVASLVAAGLGRAGFVVGLYTSPHVEHVRERVVIDGRPIADLDLARHLGRALDAREAAGRDRSAASAATWFDVLTAAALEAFAARRVDFAVVEVGLGGRLDSTNVLPAGVGVITNIDLEHVAILGHTRARIAAEKAGIIKVGATVVTGVAPDDAQAWPPIAAAAQERAARLVPVPLGAIESIEAKNRELAAAALDALGAAGHDARAPLHGPLRGGLLDPETVRAARLPGRLEVRRGSAGGPTLVLDGAHVPSSLRAVLDEIQGRPGLDSAPVVVLGLGRDKDAEGLLKVLRGRVDRVLCTSVGTGPCLSCEDLLAQAIRVGLTAEKAVAPRVALERALHQTRSDGWVLVTGSLHLVGAVRSQLPACFKNPAC